MSPTPIPRIGKRRCLSSAAIVGTVLGLIELVSAAAQHHLNRITLETSAPNVLPTIAPTLPEREFTPRCGECWCAFGDPENGDVCPEFSEGYSDSFASEVYDAYHTFQMDTAASDQFSLKTSTGEADCYPFTDLDVSSEDYPMAANPQCEFPAKSDLETAVCAFKFDAMIDDNTESCSGRSYSMNTYDSLAAALAAGAQPTHAAACGVCSDAKNLAVMMETLGTLVNESKLCGTKYFTNIFVFQRNPTSQFTKLVSCFEDIGFQGDCAVMWSHWTATTIHSCNKECIQNLDPNNNGPPPQCELSSCLKCTEKMLNSFDKITGRTFLNSGIVSDVASPCESFSNVIHDPCEGGPPTQSPTLIELYQATNSPTQSPIITTSLKVSTNSPTQSPTTKETKGSTNPLTEAPTSSGSVYLPVVFQLIISVVSVTIFVLTL